MRCHSAAQGRTLNHYFYLGAMKCLRNAVRRNDREMAVCFCGKSQSHPSIALTCADNVALTQRSTGASITKLPSHRSLRVFPVSCLKHTLRGKAFEDEERSKVRPHSNLYRCTKRPAGFAFSSGRASGINLSKLKCSGSEGIST